MNFALAAIFVVAAAALAAAQPPPPPHMEEFMKDMAFCKVKNPVTEDVVMSLHLKGALPVEGDENARCFVECMMTRTTLVDAGGKFDASTAKKNMMTSCPALYGPPGTAKPAQSVVDAAVDQCKEMSGEGKCMTNYKIWTCIFNKLHQK